MKKWINILEQKSTFWFFSISLSKPPWDWHISKSAPEITEKWTTVDIVIDLCNEIFETKFFFLKNANFLSISLSQHVPPWDWQISKSAPENTENYTTVDIHK